MIFFDEIYILSILISSIFFWRIADEKSRTWFIVLASFVALGFIQIKFTLFLLLLVLFIFYGARVIEQISSLKWFITLLITLTALLLILKYSGEFFALLFSGENEFSKKYIVPLGISYLIFKLIAYVIDQFRGTIKNPRLEELLAFILFVPIFPAGPIERYQNFAGNRKKEFEWCFYVEGLKRLSLGYFKKIVIVNFILNEMLLKVFFLNIKTGNISLELSGSQVLLFLILSFLYAYLDLSSYADIAIGYGQLFGYKICENMNYPIFQKNLSDYWSCWHISLSSWCRDNIYFPVLGKTRNVYLGLYCSFITMGLWHYINLNWLLWGIWHATGIVILTKWLNYKRKNKKLKKFLYNNKVFDLAGILCTNMYAALGYAFVTMKSASDAVRLLLAMVV